MQNLSSEKNIAGIFAIFWPTFSMTEFDKDPDRDFARTDARTLQRFTIRPRIELSKFYCEKYNKALIADNKIVSDTLELSLRATIIHELAHALFDREFNGEQRDSPRELSIEGVLSEGKIFNPSMDTGESGEIVEFMLYGGRLGIEFKDDEETSESVPHLFLKKYYLRYSNRAGKKIISKKSFDIGELLSSFAIFYSWSAFRV